MVTRKSSPPAMPPSTPPRRSLALDHTLSPPASPTTTHSADDHLEESYLFVNESDEASSDIGSSLRDFVAGDLSDSSSDAPTGRETWEDDESTGDADPHDSELAGIDMSLDGTLEGGSYIDAEATATDTDGSHATLPRLDELSDSQIKLIMPDPGSSFTTSSGSGSTSDDPTPSGSLGNLLSIIEESGRSEKPNATRRDTSSTIRPIDRSWLEASKLWQVPPDLEAIIGDHEADEKRIYQMLSSTDEVRKPVPTEQAVVTPPRPSRKSPIQPLPFRDGEVVRSSQPYGRDFHNLLRRRGTSILRKINENWSLKVSLLALASLLSLGGLFGSMGNLNSALGSRKPERPASTASMTEATTITTGKTYIWDHIGISSLSLTPTAASESASSSSTAMIPDLQIIKQALSTLSTSLNKAPPAPVEPLTTKSRKRGRKASSLSESSQPSATESSVGSSNCGPCYALSVPDANVGLTVRGEHTDLTATEPERLWSRRLSGKIRRNYTADDKAESNQPQYLIPCSCDLSDHLGAEIAMHFSQTIATTRQHSSALVHYLAGVYGPAMVELQREFQELIALFKTLSETTSTLSQFIIRRAARGTTISHHALDRALSYLQNNMPDMPRPHIPKVERQQVENAQQKMRDLSKHVERQAVLMAEYIEEQTVAMQQKSMDSLKQAKRGLDMLVQEARKAVGEHLDVVDEKQYWQPEPPTKWFWQGEGQHSIYNRDQHHMKGGRGGEHIGGRPRSQGKAHDGNRRKYPSPEKPSKGRRILDALHHGATALIL